MPEEPDIGKEKIEAQLRSVLEPLQYAGYGRFFDRDFEEEMRLEADEPWREEARQRYFEMLGDAPARHVNNFLDMLRRTEQGKTPTQDQLDALSRSINFGEWGEPDNASPRHIKIKFREYRLSTIEEIPGRKRKKAIPDPFPKLHEHDPIRLASERFHEYLRLEYQYRLNYIEAGEPPIVPESVHHSCDDCDRLYLRSKPYRFLCSDECKKKWQSGYQSWSFNKNRASASQSEYRRYRQAKRKLPTIKVSEAAQDYFILSCDPEPPADHLSQLQVFEQKILSDYGNEPIVTFWERSLKNEIDLPPQARKLIEDIISFHLEK